jgi:monofunctional biosynthetic peptidoglycan transglycosylase
MEVYLNSIEMGNGVYGAQAAAEHYIERCQRFDQYKPQE